MRMNEISLSWMIPTFLLLAGVTATVLLFLRGRHAGRRAGTDPSWERTVDRRRRKEAVFASAAYALLFCCAAVAAALSFHGLVGFGIQNLGLTGGWEYLVPFGLDGAAMFCSVLAVREASHGDAALGSRILVWTFASAAAWFNWVHAPRGLDHAGAPQFFAGMSLSAAILFDRALKQTRRAALREQGLVPRPLPQIRIVRWLRAPRETFAAWSLMLLEGVGTLDEAVEEVRDDKREKARNRLHRREQDKLDRARIKALNRQHRSWGRGGGRHALPVSAPLPPAEAAPPAGPDTVGPVDPTPLPPGEPAKRPRPALKAVVGAEPDAPGRRGTVDLTAEDDTQTIPRLDSLEEKLAEIERQFG
ncbi:MULTISPECIES: DUF2637 domain-containing protein [Streptomyces]|uniref:DUF2637 domain-containing protein n=2 Tax=Streptomyces TaxID=1883 RepID=A0A2N8PBE5_STRNR|nr:MULTISPECIES: DUF2637 domain-containing protein [Streptomyces]PNE38350.1 hypothetical protein AOB60_30325 [Streptomyces noursei]